ncbi:hypothetical protein BV25DRAFT_1963136 [Artomyces pyxidatus]|uniref:Uncharacterized protein n=1 Tax=Artomyces pyxidatus TaxID=48021 RepID=A0ACB8SST5_9AGAM|nr:hypothetical protein BV25DRAFT_1963136 [Artomyces pyxidatus]
MMNTFFFAFIPSISVRIWFSTLSPAPPASPPPPPRAFAMESNSSSVSKLSRAGSLGCTGLEHTPQRPHGSNSGSFGEPLGHSPKKDGGGRYECRGRVEGRNGTEACIAHPEIL